MKRMYVTLGVLVLVGLWAFSCLGQKKTVDGLDRAEYRMKRRMELREEMHRRMINKLLHGMGPDEDIFKDMEQMFQDSMADSFSAFGDLTAESKNYQTEWTESTTGRTLL